MVLVSRLVSRHVETGEKRVLMERRRPYQEAACAAATPLGIEAERHEEKARESNSPGWNFFVEVTEVTSE